MTEKSTESTEWDKLSGLKPKLRPHVAVHRQHFRGEMWYVLQNGVSGRFHRVSPAAYALLGRCDGKATLAQLLQSANSSTQVEPVSEEEAVLLIRQLLHSDLLQIDQNLPVDLYKNRLHAYSRIKSWRSFLNPLSLRIPLIDPDRFLDRTQSIGRAIFSPVGFLVWMAILIQAIILAGMNWDELTTNLVDRVMGTDNLLILVLVFPVVKIMHELGHGYATKKWGGEVHEIGIMFLVFMPIPYVDATAATALRDKRRRMIVAAAGMMVEVFLAALAMILWTNVEPGLVRAIAFNVIFLAGVSTLIFNGNPLLRYDGYYIFSDFLEMPNLGPRANQFIGHLMQKHLFRANVSTPESDRKEMIILVVYGILSFLYRMVVWLGIILFIATRFFFFGVVLAFWGAYLMLIKPLYKQIVYLVTSPILEEVRRRSYVATAACLAGLLAFLLLLPLPHAKVLEGVVWMPEGALVRAGAAGFVDRLYPDINAEVSAGDALVELEDPIARSEVDVLEAQVRELEAEYQSALAEDRVRTDIVNEQLQLINSRLREARRTLADMLAVSPSEGQFMPVEMGDYRGRYVQKGELLGYVLGQYQPTIKAIVDQQDYLLVKDRYREIEARFAENFDARVQLQLIQEVPAATDELPSRALSQEGGGDVYLDPSDQQGNRGLQSHFEFELAAQSVIPTERSGGRVYVRFDLGHEPIFWRVYRNFRQLFLREFAI